MKTYKVVSKDGRTTLISSRTKSEAFQKASDFCKGSLIESFEEI